MKKLGLLLTGVIITFSLAGCGSSELVGVWQYTKDSELYIEFNKDGTSLLEHEGTYKIKDKNHVEITENDDTYTEEFEIDGDILTIGGKEFERVE